MENKKKALVIVAHNDDEVLGCGGTIKKMRSEGWDVGVLIMTLGTMERGEIPDFTQLMKQSYDASVHLGAGPKEDSQSFGYWGVFKEKFADQRLDEYTEIDITKKIELHLEKFRPQVVFTHFEHDINKDHEIVSKCVRVACRMQPNTFVDALYEFPVLSSSNHNSVRFVPDMYVELIEEEIAAKVSAMKCYKVEYTGMRREEHIRITAMANGIDVGFTSAEVFRTVRRRKKNFDI
jgi:LmbE family N-acetylglucosaminyl deacetylase